MKCFNKCAALMMMAVLPTVGLAGVAHAASVRAASSETTACNVTRNGTTCYPTEREMDVAIAASVSRGPAFPAGTCAVGVRLYDGTSFTGSVVNITITGSDVALSTLGFASRTSSYKIGSCSTTFKKGSSVYPGTTAPNVSSTSMLSGWDNAITIVRM